ncbi:MAG: Gfo/Idh/MocA family oxidoreductase [Eubacteriales bacterium]|nr:Gfo/Idh/MocA family oxidoreductase [Eubacteriales bacterium]
MSGRGKPRVAVFGAGYWAQFQIPAWQALGIEVTAIWNRSRGKAEAAARKFAIPAVYDSPEDVFKAADFDIADIITDASTHEALVELAAGYGKDVISQKPMAESLSACRNMVQTCGSAGVWFAVHENFRYQPQFKQVKQILESGELGRLLRAHLVLKSPDRAIMESQPALKTMDHMVLRDMGPHLFDVARCLFGESSGVYSKGITTYPDINVIDSAIQVMSMESGLVLGCDLVHTSPYRLYIAGSEGTLRLGTDNTIQIETAAGSRRVEPEPRDRLAYIPEYDWALHGGHVFLSIEACLRDLIDAWQSDRPAPTSGADNLITMKLVFAAIDSQDRDCPVQTGHLTD